LLQTGKEKVAISLAAYLDPDYTSLYRLSLALAARCVGLVCAAAIDKHIGYLPVRLFTIMQVKCMQLT